MIPLVAPICMMCRRFRLEGGYGAPPSCEAFPHGIPSIILEEGADHRQPIEGDNGIQFEAREGVTPAEIEAWARDREEAA